MITSVFQYFLKSIKSFPSAIVVLSFSRCSEAVLKHACLAHRGHSAILECSTLLMYSKTYRLNDIWLYALTRRFRLLSKLREIKGQTKLNLLCQELEHDFFDRNLKYSNSTMNFGNKKWALVNLNHRVSLLMNKVQATALIQ